MNVNTAALALICILACCAETAQTPYPAEQTHFSAEEEGVQKPVPLPQDVLAILGKDDVVRGQLENANLSPQHVPQSWFSASEIHLSDHRKPDLIVVGGQPLAGANTVPFWIFRATSQGYELVLFVGSHDLEVKTSRSHGYRNIETRAVVMQQLSTVKFRFNGRRYINYRDMLEPINQTPTNDSLKAHHGSG
jgi:hypothetical protein